VEKKRRLTIPWVNFVDFPFLKREKADNTINLRREEGTSVKSGQLLDFIRVQMEGQLVDSQMLRVIMLEEFYSRRPLLILSISSVSNDILEIALHH